MGIRIDLEDAFAAHERRYMGSMLQNALGVLARWSPLAVETLVGRWAQRPWSGDRFPSRLKATRGGGEPMGRVIHFEIPVDDPERAQKFYANVFGWEMSSWGGPAEYRLATTGPEDAPGINGALTPRSGNWAPVHVGVDSVDEALKKVEEAGGEVLTPKMSIPGIGYMAYCKDTEGNGVGLFQEDPTAQM